MPNTTYPDNDPYHDHTRDFWTSSMLPPAPKIRTPERVTQTSVMNAYQEWLTRQGRLYFLWRYYRGYQRNLYALESEPDKSFVVSNMCKYITKTIKSYMVGNRPAYVADDADSYGLKITELFEEQDKWRVDARLVQDASIFGRAFELVYLDEDGTPKSQAISPEDAFVAYSDDIECDSVFGLVRYKKVREDGSHYYKLYVYTRDEVMVWNAFFSSEGKGDDRTGIELVPDMKTDEDGTLHGVPHGFGRVPLIEYANNEEYTGDFEDIIGLQDAYNQLQSDRLDDKNAFASAMLVLQGFVLDDEASGISQKTKALKELKVLQMPDEGHAEYLTKTLDESNVQILQDHYTKDIHKLAMVPDLSDEQFSGNASGVAMAYKLFGTDQVVSDKVALYQQGYTRRCKLYDSALFNPTANPDYEPLSDISKMRIQFKFNIVQDLSYMSSAITQLVQAGILSKETAMEALAIIDDPKKEMERVQADAQQNIENQQAMFEDDYTHQFEGGEQGADGTQSVPPGAKPDDQQSGAPNPDEGTPEAQATEEAEDEQAEKLGSEPGDEEDEESEHSDEKPSDEDESDEQSEQSDEHSEHSDDEEEGESEDEPDTAEHSDDDKKKPKKKTE